MGLPDAALGQRPAACVTVRAGASPPDHDELVEAVARGVGRPVPALAVVVVEAMPMTPTGKISKARLVASIEG